MGPVQHPEARPPQQHRLLHDRAERRSSWEQQQQQRRPPAEGWSETAAAHHQRHKAKRQYSQGSAEHEELPLDKRVRIDDHHGRQQQQHQHAGYRRSSSPPPPSGYSEGHERQHEDRQRTERTRHDHPQHHHTQQQQQQPARPSGQEQQQGCPQHKLSPDVLQRDQHAGRRPQQQQAAQVQVHKQDSKAQHEQQGGEPNTAPKRWRAPQPLSGTNRMPSWVDDCFAKDEMALVSEKVHGIRFLREGVAPQVGMGLYMQMTYEHDGSHSEAYRGWARMIGRITRVYEPPEVGVYAVYEGQTPRLTPKQLEAERWQLPALPPPLFGARALCACCRTAEQVVAKYGAVHGQRIRADIWLSKNDAALQPQLGGTWDVELVCNDNLQAMWVVSAMQPAPAASAASACKKAAAKGGGAAAAAVPGAPPAGELSTQQVQQREQRRA